MQQFNLKDKTLYYLNTNRYQNSLVSDRHPKYFEWVQGNEDLPTFYTYFDVENELRNGREKESNLILLESTAIIPEYQKWAFSNQKRFNKIYTHNSHLLNLCKNARWIPGGGIWIGTEFGGGEARVKKKTKLCSFVSSNKAMCHLHKLRLTAFNAFKGKVPTIDFFGTAQGGLFVKAAEYLQDYMFSIVFENYEDDLYFTEKLLNCFATGTIPVYIGARNISKIFNGGGILQFKNLVELTKIIPTLSEDLYVDKLEAVQDNFSRCFEFTCVEDYMWSNYMKDEYERWNPTE